MIVLPYKCLCLIFMCGWSMRSSQGLKSTPGRGLIFIYLAMCHFHAYIRDVYDLFSSPITHSDGKRDCYFFSHLKSLFTFFLYQSHS